jgi:hypothetical protein
MSEGLERLKQRGAQKIYEETHIPTNQVQAILYENFDGLTRVQFIGFISILEREYGEDLSAIKERGLEFFDEQNREETEYTEHIFVDSNARKKQIGWILFALVVCLSLVFYFTMSSKETALVEEGNTSVVEKKQENIEKEEKTKTKEESPQIQKEPKVKMEAQKTAVEPYNDVNLTAKIVEQNTTQLQPLKEKALPKALKIVPKTRVWLGYIDVKTNKKYSKTIKQSFTLDPSKEWLLLFGHGYVTLYVDEVKYDYAQKGTLRLHYKDGKLKKVSEKEFKRLNRGRKW